MCSCDGGRPVSRNTLATWLGSSPLRSCRGETLTETNRPAPRAERECQRVAASHAVRRSEEHTSELQSREKLVCRLLLEKKKEYETYIWQVDSHAEIDGLH